MNNEKNKNERPWYSAKSGLFGAEYMREYKDILTEERTQKEVNFILKTVKLKRGSKILDIPCGFGRHSIELAKRGYDVTGQDINGYFLDLARRSAKKHDVSPRFLKADMRKIDFENEFDLVLNLFTSIGYFEKEDDDILFLREASKSLKKGGKLLVDTVNRERVLGDYMKKSWSELQDGTIILFERKFDQVSGTSYEQRIVIDKAGRRKRISIVLRLYALSELISLVERSGFKFESVFGDFEGGEYGLKSTRCIVLASKK